jgi:DNA polymerase-3 subunit gamma/tau
MVTTQGFNALLKIVEEPPAHIKFIFATTEPEKVIGTIRSRTHHYPFRLVPPAQMLEYLESVCESEGVQVAPGVISLVVRAGGGSVRDSLSLMDQLIAGSEGARVEYELATALLGFTHSELLNEVVDAFATRNGADVFSAVDRVIQTGQDPRRFVEDLLEHLRNLILVVSTGENAKSVLRGIAADEIEKMTIQAYQFGLSELTHAANVVSQSLNEMSGATSPKILLELMCARVLVPSSDVTEVGSLARIERLERRIGVTAPASEIASASTRVAPAPDAPAAPAAEPAPVESAPVSIGALTLAQVQKEWPEVLKTLANISRSTWVAAQTIKIAALADGIVTLEFPNQSESDTFKRSAGGPENLRKAIQEVLGFTPQFKAQVAADSAPSLPPKVTSSLPSMPAPGPAFPEQISAPAPAPAAAPAKKSASAAAAPLPVAEESVAEEPVAEEPVAPEPVEEAPVDEPTEEQPVAAAESGMGKVHQGASYGEPLLREILGAKPVDDIKGGR